MADTVTLGNLIVLLGVVSGVVALLMNARKVRREDASDAQGRTDRIMAEVTKHNEQFEDRLKEVEITIRDFMPRREIETKIEHEKINRTAGQQGMIDTQREQARVLGDMQREQARFGAQLESSTSIIAKLEASVDRLVSHVNEKLDKMNDCLTSISRKVG